MTQTLLCWTCCRTQSLVHSYRRCAIKTNRTHRTLENFVPSLQSVKTIRSCCHCALIHLPPNAFCPRISARKLFCVKHVITGTYAHFLLPKYNRWRRQLWDTGEHVPPWLPTIFFCLLRSHAKSIVANSIWFPDRFESVWNRPRQAFYHAYTLCLKKFPPLNSLQLCQILADFQNFCIAESLWNLLQKPHNIAQLTLGMLLHYPGISKIQFSANIQQMWKNAKK